MAWARKRRQGQNVVRRPQRRWGSSSRLLTDAEYQGKDLIRHAAVVDELRSMTPFDGQVSWHNNTRFSILGRGLSSTVLPVPCAASLRLALLLVSFLFNVFRPTHTWALRPKLFSCYPEMLLNEKRGRFSSASAMSRWSTSVQTSCLRQFWP